MLVASRPNAAARSRMRVRSSTRHGSRSGPGGPLCAGGTWGRLGRTSVTYRAGNPTSSTPIWR